jgi:hypothetical protein
MRVYMPRKTKVKKTKKSKVKQQQKQRQSVNIKIDLSRRTVSRPSQRKNLETNRINTPMPQTIMSGQSSAAANDALRAMSAVNVALLKQMQGNMTAYRQAERGGLRVLTPKASVPMVEAQPSEPEPEPELYEPAQEMKAAEELEEESEEEREGRLTPSSSIGNIFRRTRVPRGESMVPNRGKGWFRQEIARYDPNADVSGLTVAQMRSKLNSLKKQG